MAKRTYSAAEKLAWQQERFTHEIAAGRYSGADLLRAREFVATGKVTRPPPAGMNVFGREGTLSKQLDQALQRSVNKAIADKAPKGATLRMVTSKDAPASTCLEELSWKDGVATTTFYRGGDVVYDYPMSKSEFIDWVSSNSIGIYGNDEVF
jgi:hypothetical protein